SRHAAGVGVEFDIVFSIPDYDWSGLTESARKKIFALAFLTKTFWLSWTIYHARVKRSNYPSKIFPQTA
ncbi:MAG TPA: hypothetical protein PLG97_10790, partial [Alcaligenes sp.]|nr:hypothetical protein [Alcaligenes sp.]